MATIHDDPRIDPRIKALMGGFPSGGQPDVASRDLLLAEVNTPEAVAVREAMLGMFEAMDNEDIAPRAGLDISTVEFTSSPDGNTVKIQMIRPQTPDPLPCVYYIHGGGMQTMSCFDGMYRSWVGSSRTRAWPWRWSTSATA